MTKKKKIIILAAVLLFAAALSVAIPVSRLFFRPYGRQEVLDSEHAIQIARAAIIQRYGESEIEDMEFMALGGNVSWMVIEGDSIDDIRARNRMGHLPTVYVRNSDGMVTLMWRDNSITRIARRVPFR